MQRTLKVDHAIPAGRVVVAGSGPFLFAVAAQLVAAGVSVAAVIESRSRRALAGVMRDLIKSPRLRAEAAQYLLRLRRHHVPILYGSVVTEARGRETLEGVEVAKCDHRGLPLLSRTSISAQALALSFGFIPSTEVAALAGCRTRVDEFGDVVVDVDDNMATTVPGLFCAGQPTGITGWEIALAKGRVAGLAAARVVGCAGATERLERMRAQLDRLVRSSRRRQAWLAPMPGWNGLVNDNTVVCRCEHVTWGDARHAGAPELQGRTPTDLKALTRCGMGPCQARICGPILRGLVTGEYASDRSEWDGFTVRPPLASVTVGQVAASELLNINQQAGGS